MQNIVIHIQLYLGAKIVLPDVTQDKTWLSDDQKWTNMLKIHFPEQPDATQDTTHEKLKMGKNAGLQMGRRNVEHFILLQKYASRRDTRYNSAAR